MIVFLGLEMKVNNNKQEVDRLFKRFANHILK